MKRRKQLTDAHAEVTPGRRAVTAALRQAREGATEPELNARLLLAIRHLEGEWPKSDEHAPNKD